MLAAEQQAESIPPLVAFLIMLVKFLKDLGRQEYLEVGLEGDRTRFWKGRAAGRLLAEH